jgi:Flp pilus assembly protein TadD
MGNHGLAILDYTEVIRLNPSGADAFHNRAISHSAMGNHGLADQDARRARELERR